MKAMVIEITLKSGAKVKAKVKEFTVKTNQLTGQKSYEWESFDDCFPRLASFNVDEIACIVRLK